MRRRLACLALLALLAGACGGDGSEKPSAVDETNQWVVVEPTSEGLDESELSHAELRIRDELPDVRSVLVARNGRLVLERYYGGAGPEARFEVYSVTKSVVSALVGIVLAEGKLRGVHQPLAAFFPRYVADGADPRLRRLTLDDLLTMRAGYPGEPIESSTNWIRALMARPFVDEPGTRFVYDSGSSHLLSGVLTRLTGKTASALARERLFRPLGVEDGWIWPDDGQGISVGGDGLALRARDLAKVGQLYLQEGQWNGVQIVPAEWVRRSTRIHARVGEPGRGYGYQWWVNERSYAALGYGGQALVVYPGLDLVVVITNLPVENADIPEIVDRVIVPVVAAR